MIVRVRRTAVVALALWLAVAALPGWAGQEIGPVRSGDSLWKIADRIAANAGVSRDQVMLALLEANPDAVTPPCNVSGVLRVGVVLQVPTTERLGALDAATARRIIERQAREWVEHRRSGQPLTCLATVEQPPAAPMRSESELSPPAIPEPTSPAPSMATGQTTNETCPCSSDQPRSAPPLAARTAHAKNSEAPPHLPDGPLAPVWLLIPLVIGLLAVSLVRRGGRATTAALEPSGIAATADRGAPAEAAALPSRRVSLLLTLKEGELVFLLLAALAGLLGALVTVLFREGIHGLEWLLVGHSGSLVLMALGLPPWQRLLWPAVGGLVAGLILEQIGARLRGRKTTDYMEAVAVGDGWISVRQSLVKSVSSMVTVAFGGSIGREGAMVQLSAMVASTLGRIAHFPRDRLRLLVAAGAAAGLAAAYNAPLAATLFVAEIVLGSIAIQHIGPLIVAAVIANATVHDIMGYAPLYQIPAFSLVSNRELVLYLALGIIAGHTAPIFLGLLERSHRAFARLPMPLAGRMALGGLIVGAISVYEPAVWGNGYSVINTVFHQPWAWQALLTVMVLKMIATAATHGSGAVGGAFTPTMFVGALLGVLFGTAVHAVLPVGAGPPSAYAVVGMGAMLAATTHAPLMSILMVFEMTMDYQIVLPLMLAVVAAHYTMLRYVDVAPMYAESLLPHDPEARG